MRNVYGRAHRLQAFDVQIHRPRTNGTTAWQGHPSRTKTGQQWAQYQYGSTHGFHHFISGLEGGHIACIQAHLTAITGNFYAHGVQ